MAVWLGTMVVWLATLLPAISVKQDQAPLRNGCDADASIVAKLPAGTEVTIGFAMSGAAEACYKITAKVDGKELRGYVSAGQLEGLDTFEQGLRSAPALGFNDVIAVVSPPAAAAGSKRPATVADRTVSLLETGQAESALELIEPAAKATKDPSLLALAGAAAWRADDPGKALGYWREALDLHPDPALQNLYARVEKESANDKSSARIFGIHIAFRYESGAIGSDTAHAMVGVLDQEFARVSAALDCSTRDRIVAIAQSPEAYRKTTDAAEWSGGQFDGRIRVPVFPNPSAKSDQPMDATLRRTLAHEMTHACLSMTGVWPAWLQEGLAQKLSGDVVSAELRDKLAEWQRDGKLPRLSGLGQDWSRMDTAHAVAAYGLSLQAVDSLYASYGPDGVRNLLRNPSQLPAVTADLDQRLGLKQN